MVGWLTRRHDPLTSLLLTIPIFFIYHLGILLPFIRMRNGVDFVSGLTFQLIEQSLLGYIGLTVAYAAAIAVAVYVLRQRGAIHPTEWLPMLGESLVLALVMSFTVGWATSQVFAAQVVGDQVVGAQVFAAQVGPVAMNPAEKLVMAAGAGFHEELIFRVVLFAGGTLLLTKVARLREWQAALVAALVSSLVFSAIHYVGDFGDPLQADSFLFRALAGLFLAAVYRFRGFAVAVYTHTIYDLIVFFL